MTQNNIVDIDIKESVKESYLDYSMSVILGRALPDARDGLKPVHRRILFAMKGLGLNHKAAYKKSARIVGDVIGKYHPHGDSAVYNALVRMAQDFSMREMLVDGQGNFGSVDGDSPAAMRYTEARLTSIASWLLSDIDKNTVDFNPNYDGTTFEPDVLPSRLPNLLLNGAEGIAVGMSTKIPPHRLDELVDALVYLIDNKDATLADIMGFVEGPDFPTGGIIYGRSGIYNAYATGNGSIRVRAKVHIEKTKSRDIIIIDELPFQVNKAKLVEAISRLAREKMIEGIHEIRDESDMEGMRVVLELKRDAMSEIVLNHLYKSTNMEISFGIILRAIVNKEPRMLTLMGFLEHFINHRKTIVIRRTIFELEEARARAHILEGFLIALDNIEEVVRIIRASKDTEAASIALQENFTLSLLQAKSILDMSLKRLTGLEVEKIQSEYKELVELMERLSALLKSEDKINALIKEELLEIKAAHSTKRRTMIEENYDAIDMEDLIPNEDVVVTMSHRGYVKRVLLKNYEKQNRGGKGKISANTHDDDFIESFFTVKTHDTIMFITDRGQLYWLKAYKIPEAARTAIGKAVVNLIDIEKDERIMATVTTSSFGEDRTLAFFTKNGLIKRTRLSEYSNIRRAGVRAINLDEGDEVVTAGICDEGTKQLFVATNLGQCIRFDVEEARIIGRVSRGVKAISFKSPSDYVIGALLISSENNKILTLSELGIGKQTEVSAYTAQRRTGKGVIVMKLTNKTGKLVSILNVDDESKDIMVLTSVGKMIRISPQTIRKAGRNTIGVKIVSLKSNEKVVYASLAPISEEDEHKDNED